MFFENIFSIFPCLICKICSSLKKFLLTVKFCETFKKRKRKKLDRTFF